MTNLTPDWDSQDFYLPTATIHLLTKKKLVDTDLLVLWVILGHTQPVGSNDGPLGCPLTNRELSRLAKRSERKIEKSIENLRALGQLLIIEYDGHRYLEVEWARISLDKATLTGGYGKAYRKAHQELEHRLANR